MVCADYYISRLHSSEPIRFIRGTTSSQSVKAVCSAHMERLSDFYTTLLLILVVLCMFVSIYIDQNEICLECALYHEVIMYG